MSPDYIGQATPRQLVQIRLGRFTRYQSEGGGHQPWNAITGGGYPVTARVGTPMHNPFYYEAWQALWLPSPGAAGTYQVVPNVLEVKLSKKLEIGGVQSATIDIENILYPDAGGYHVRERGAMAPLRGVTVPGTPELPRLLDELGLTVSPNEWEGRFSFEAQVTIYQGYGDTLLKVFTGLIEDADLTSRPDRITLTCRDFGKVFGEEHFFGWNKDPVIDTPVTFIDRESPLASKVHFEGSSAHASSNDATAGRVIDGNKNTAWRSAVHTGPENTEYIEVAISQGIYEDFDFLVPSGYEASDFYISMRPAKTKAGDAPSRNGVPLTIANSHLDLNGWVDLAQITSTAAKPVPGESYPYMNSGSVPAGYQRHYFDPSEAEYLVGDNTVIRLSFRKLAKVSGQYAAAVSEFYGRRLELTEPESEGGIRPQWVVTNDISDVVKVICQWAGFKEWDIEETGTRLPSPITADPTKSYLDIIKQLAEGIGFNFYMADPLQDSDPKGASSLGVPTFRKPQVLEPDSGGIPIITDRHLLTAIEVKQSSEPLAYVIRTYGYTKVTPGDPEHGIKSGKRVVYTFRPPWTGTPPTYADSRLAGILKQVIHKGEFWSTTEDVEVGALLIALQEALGSIQATIEFPAYPPLDLDMHARLMDLGTGISTRIAVAERSSTFKDGEQRKWTMQVTGPLIDTPDIRDMVNIINDPIHFPPNGEGKEWANPRVGTPSSLGYG